MWHVSGQPAGRRTGLFEPDCLPKIFNPYKRFMGKQNQRASIFYPTRGDSCGASSRLDTTRSIMPYSTACSALMM